MALSKLSNNGKLCNPFLIAYRLFSYNDLSSHFLRVDSCNVLSDTLSQQPQVQPTLWFGFNCVLY